jgi:hypothetical protein
VPKFLMERSNVNSGTPEHTDARCIAVWSRQRGYQSGLQAAVSLKAKTSRSNIAHMGNTSI